MNRAATLALVLLALPLAAPAKDLIGVFEDAVHNDPVIRQADANRLAARESKPQALSALLPQLNGTAGITRDHSSGFQSQIFEVASSDPTCVANPSLPQCQPHLAVTRTADQIDNTIQQWALNLRQNVFSWSNWMALKAASREVAQAEANYAAAEQQLILRVAQAYFNVLTAIDTLDADQTSLEAISRQLDQANKRFEVGLIAITDVEDAKAARDSAASTVIAAKRTLATSEDQLQEITGEKYDALAKPGSDMPLNNPEPADQSRWVNISLEQNLSLISSRLSADIARENVRVAQGGHLPTLDLVAGRSWNYTSSDQIFDGTPFSNVDSKVNDRQIGLQFTLPIYSGGFTQSKVRQAVESNHTSLKATEAGYEVGTRTSVDVLNARRLTVQAETDYATARYDYIVSVLQLRLAAGNLDRTQLAELNNWLTVKAPTSPAIATPESVSPTVPPSQPVPPPPATTPPTPRPQGKR